MAKAFHHLSRAADQGNPYAQYKLGALYLDEEYKDIRQAVRYLTLAADRKNEFAAYRLGKLYLLGKDIPQDREKAYGYLMQSAEQGNIYATYFLEHFNDTPHPVLLLMATRLMHHLSHIVRDDVTGGRKSANSSIDRKLARKIKQKKIGQGHAADDQEMQGQVL